MLAALTVALALAGAFAGVAAADDISACQKILTSVGLKPDGTTLFCPSTDAFASFADDLGTDLPGLLALVPRSTSLFKMIMQGHTVNGIISKSQLKSGQSLTSLAGGKLNVVPAGGGLGLKWRQVDWDPDSESGSADDVEADVDTTDLAFPGTKGKPNYVIHSIDGVIIPEKAVAGVSQIAAALAN